MKAFSRKTISDEEEKNLQKQPTFPFILDETSICYVYSCKEGGKELVWISSKIDVISYIYDEENHTIQINLKIYTPFGDNEVIVDKGLITIRRLEELSQYGVNFHPEFKPLLYKYLIRKIENAPTQQRYASCGWNQYGNFLGFDDGYAGNINLSMRQTSEQYFPMLNNLMIV